VVLVFGLAGSFLLVSSHAATPAQRAEAENGTATVAAAVSDATASGGQAVKFAAAARQTTNCLPPLSQTMTNAVSHLCGFPDATNTGVPPGTQLTPSGSITVTQDGAVVQNLDINGNITVLANNVTIKNTRITSGDYYPIRYFDDNNTGLLVEDTEIIGTNSDVTAGMSFSSFKLLRVNIHGAADGVKVEDDTDVEDSYIHDLAIGEDTHNDGLQSTGGSNITINHNSIILSADVSSCMQFGNENGDSSNVTISNNLFDGGGYCVRIYGNGTNNKVLNNHFGHDEAYGVYDITDPGVTVTGNVWDDSGDAKNS